MVFSSAIFLFFFLPIVLGLYFLAPPRARNLLLLVASLWFYAWGETAYVALILASGVMNYAFGRWGEDHVAMVCTHNTFQERSALRETAKAFGLSNEQISRWDKADFQRDGNGTAGSTAGITATRPQAPRR